MPVRTDYLTVTAKIPAGDQVDVPVSLGRLMRAATGNALGDWTNRRKGLLGYGQSMSWEHGGAVAAWGGQRDTVMISLPGAACELIQDWDRLVAALRDCLGAKITRWDGAADDHAGEHSVDRAASAWKAGRWTQGGRPPSASCAGNWLRPDGKGRTLYVGSRKNGKMARVYEKGKQLGDAASPWVRWEIELHNVDREIPWEAVLDPRPFIAGAYPPMSWVADGGPAKKVPTSRPSGKISVDHLMRHAGLAYGRLIDTLITRGIEPLVVLDMMRRSGVPRRLEQDELLRVRESDQYTPTPIPAWLIAAMQRRAQEAPEPPVVRVDSLYERLLSSSPPRARDRDGTSSGGSGPN